MLWLNDTVEKHQLLKHLSISKAFLTHIITEDITTSRQEEEREGRGNESEEVEEDAGRESTEQQVDGEEGEERGGSNDRGGKGGRQGGRMRPNNGLFVPAE